MIAAWQEQRPSAAMASRRLSFFAAVLLGMSGAGHRYGLIETVPFLWLLGLVGTIAVVGLGFGAIALAQTWELGSGGLADAVAGLILACLVLAPFAVSALRVVQHPRLVDVSTDVDFPPPLVHGAALRRGIMNQVAPIDRASAQLQRQRYPGLIGRRYEHSAETISAVVLDVMRQRGWEPRRIDVDPRGAERILIEGTARSLFLGFPADVSVRIAEEHTATFVDMRSASRYGRHDLGDNATRIRRFLERLDERVALLSGG